MALGRQRARQADVLVTWAELPRSPGHAFYDELQAELLAADFDGFVEGGCAPCYASRRGRPSLPPGRYFRMLLLLRKWPPTDGLNRVTPPLGRA